MPFSTTTSLQYHTPKYRAFVIPVIFFFFFFLGGGGGGGGGGNRFGFYGPFKNILHIEPIVHQRWEKTRTRGKTTWPSVSRTWLSHMWPERGSNHSGEKPNGLGVSYLLGYGGRHPPCYLTPYLSKVLGQPGLNKQCRTRSECGIWSGSPLFATLLAVLIH